MEAAKAALKSTAYVSLDDSGKLEDGKESLKKEIGIKKVKKNTSQMKKRRGM